MSHIPAASCRRSRTPIAIDSAESLERIAVDSWLVIARSSDRNSRALCLHLQALGSGSPKWQAALDGESADVRLQASLSLIKVQQAITALSNAVLADIAEQMDAQADGLEASATGLTNALKNISNVQKVMESVTSVLTIVATILSFAVTVEQSESRKGEALRHMPVETWEDIS